jgi:hypothetical protein
MGVIFKLFHGRILYLGTLIRYTEFCSFISTSQSSKMTHLSSELNSEKYFMSHKYIQVFHHFQLQKEDFSCNISRICAWNTIFQLDISLRICYNAITNV